MIHLIYIYFIVNAFLAGCTVGNKEGVITFFIAVLVGSPLYGILFIYACAEAFIKWSNDKALIKGWYRLYFTNYFAKLGDGTVRIRQAQYWGHKVNGVKANSYGRFFLRQLDKKYNYGITKPFDHE